MIRRRAWAFLSSGWRPVVFDILILAALVWGARFWHSSGFGLYEDDYTKIPWAMGMTWSEVWHQVSEYFRLLGDNAKPLHAALIFLLSFASSRLGGLQAAYVVGFLVVASAPILFYLLLLRVSDRSLALPGALAFALFPADTTQAFLTHALGLQWSLVFLLLAFHAYLSGRRVLAYGLAVLILITYETPFLVFLAAPLLGTRWDRSAGRRLVGHVLILLVLIGLVVMVRFAIGEARVSSIEPLRALRIAFGHMALGPIAILGLAIYRPYQLLQSLDLETALAWLGCLIVVLASLWTLGRAPGREEAALRFDLKSGMASLGSRERLSEWLSSLTLHSRLLLVGGGMLALAYPLTLTLSAFESAGRATRVHLGAAVGGSLVFAVLASTLLAAARRNVAARLLRAGLAMLLAAYFAFGFVIQRDYRTAWSLQRTFWSDLIRLAPDAGEGTAILVDPAGLIDVAQIGANTWNLPRILERLYDFPESWQAPPRVYRLREGWSDRIVTEAGMFRLDGTTVNAPPSLYGEALPQNVILIDTSSGSLVREAGPIVLQGRTYHLQSASTAVLDTLPRGPLYAVMLAQ